VLSTTMVGTAVGDELLCWQARRRCSRGTVRCHGSRPCVGLVFHLLPSRERSAMGSDGIKSCAVMGVFGSAVV
jgi:hypothetical protein